MRRFILFHDKRHPRDLWEPAVAEFSLHLTVEQPLSDQAYAGNCGNRSR